MQFEATLLMREFVTHDVRRFILTRPEDLFFKPGQGVEVVIDQPEWREEEGRPFTPVMLPGDRVLEFLIKRYSDHHGVTDKLHALSPGDRLLISEPFGTITYQGAGVFIAAGAGITPFLAIFRKLAQDGRLADHVLYYSNKTRADIICEKELRHYFGDKAFFTCTREKPDGYGHGRIDPNFLKANVKDFGGSFYVCGPDTFVERVSLALRELGASPETIVFEE